MTKPFLQNIFSPNDVKSLTTFELEQLAAEIQSGLDVEFVRN